MIGRLDQIIAIERASFVSDGAAGRIPTWAELVEDPRPFAKVELKAGSESGQAGGDVARQRATFTIRARFDLKATDRIRWGGLV